MATPLAGVKVLDFTRVLAGPHCVKLLRDLGASIVKVEPPSGDLARLSVPHTNGLSHYYAQQNAGKRNISIDLNYPEARSLVMRLAGEADVIVENFRPGTLAFYGLDYASVAARNPGVVYASISGYGQTGPWKNRAGFAPTVQAETGFTDALLEHFDAGDGAARNDLSSHADVYTGMEACVGILAALHQRRETGTGQQVDVAMAATILSVNERFHFQTHDLDTDDEPIALSAAESPIIKLPDGTRLTIAGSPVYTPIFGRYCAMMRRTDLLDDPRFATPALRRKNLPELLDEVRSWILTFNERGDLEAQVKVAGLAIGVLRTVRQFVESEWGEHRNIVVEVSDGDMGVVKTPGPPWLFSGADFEPPQWVARRGQHNVEVLTEMGLSAAEIERLQARGVLSSG
jgi:crotonobetainyl-CoA:carnitine CoA-transferase CaiB-like acyl-CoA transferase